MTPEERVSKNRRFCAFVPEEFRDEAVAMIREAVAEEREACAKVADDIYQKYLEPEVLQVASWIRSRQSP